MVLEELGLTYKPIYLTSEKGEHKVPDGINPSWCILALVDHTMQQILHDHAILSQ